MAEARYRFKVLIVAYQFRAAFDRGAGYQYVVDRNGAAASPQGIHDFAVYRSGLEGRQPDFDRGRKGTALDVCYSVHKSIIWIRFIVDC